MSDVIRKGKGVGYKDTQTGKTCMTRCFKCGKENWAAAVASGQCAWCGYNPNMTAVPNATHSLNGQVVKKVAKAGKTQGAVKSLIVEDQLNLAKKKRSK